ncbi:MULTISPECIES: hypothetical protein [Sorangium]|uniref:Uncharacterized protein n=1 Tax=Sorangium cellulosum TaxID=56 RepID=A0A4P2QMM3_SORCE|nr:MULTISPECIES: hypothetical protein [Sorangium]AUX31051.1 uncharacterized protein SOCE836_031680 [Sorangium cellulosum]WCQ90432.1 hypothetical protein NQZ70_03136 [Sorangium sp. Soce836]
MLGDQELEVGHDMEGAPADMEDEPPSTRTPSLEEARAGFMLLDL